jgi:hypothetical protein
MDGARATRKIMPGPYTRRARKAAKNGRLELAALGHSPKPAEHLGAKLAIRAGGGGSRVAEREEAACYAAQKGP